MILGVAVTAFAYGLGSIPFGSLVVRWRTGRDIRALGSGRTGGRNVARQLGTGWGLATGALDVLKGAVAALVGLALSPAWLAPAMSAAVAGHIWPLGSGFRGGRGIAPAFGAVLVADPLTAAASLAGFGAVAAITRRTMPGLAAGVAVAPLVAILAGRPIEIVAGVVGVVALVLVGHRSYLGTGLRRALGSGS